MSIPILKKTPIRKNFAANLYGIGVQLINQILLVPFYIVYWGDEQYCDWIVISSLTAFFTMSDIGLNNVIQNRFAIKMAEGNTKECDSLLTDNFVLVSIIFSVALILSGLFLKYMDITSVMHIGVFTRQEVSIVFMLLICRVFADMYRNIVNAIYRAVHNASRAILFDQTTTLCIALLTLLCIVLEVHVTWMCFYIILPSVGMLVFKYFDVKKYYNYSLSISQFDSSLLKQIFIPALSFMSFPAANTIVLQGYTLVVNTYFGPAAVVLYNTTRTLCNFVKTFLGTIQNSVWPEYSIAYGKQDFSTMRALHRKMIKVTIATAFIIGTLLLLAGPFIYDIWTHSKVKFNYPLMFAYILVLFVESLWTSSSVTLVATNNHVKLGIYYIAFTLIALLIAVILGIINMPLWVITSTLILSNMAMCLYTIPAGFKLTNDNILND